MSAAPARTVADAVGERLAALGVECVFGLIGSGNFVVTNALRRGGARFVAARHECGAVMMADGWARVSNRVGVCSVHQGPGLTNAITGLAEAAKSRTPLLVLSGDTPAAALTSNFRIDQDALVQSVGAVAERLHSPETAEADAARALRRAELERRPVVLSMPIDVQAQPAPQPAVGVQAAQLPTAPSARASEIAAAAKLLAAAQRPLLLGGRGAVLSDAGPAIVRLGETCGALLASTAVAHGIFDGDPYAIGICGGFATPLAAELVRDADVIVAFGATLNAWTTRHGTLLAPDVKLVQVDVDPLAIGLHHPVDVAVVGDAQLAAWGLFAELARTGDTSNGMRNDELRGEIAAAGWRDEPYETGGTAGVIDPRTLSIALADLLPHDKNVVVDSGHLTGWPAMYLDIADPRAWLFVNGFQAVGLGLGAAIGAALAAPQRVTVAALGDGGLFLSLAELDTAARTQARLLIVVYDDAAYGAEVHHFGPLGHDTEIARHADADLAAIARGAGVAAVTVRFAGDLEAVATWLRDGHAAGPLLVDAKVDPGVCADWLTDAFR
jgi:thiamine pyrophosphate-dependent acetolactate synthase large subunit-like protein